ncbi:Semialdehyde dehydrogenase [Cocos nucifera]|uniref:Probable N-acetyl-gamma-glutamyl-phosphate reductase, chloroplastic n=1 Tax=Cocos nucifera TaxID=13894 RepID=A0A8K0IW14_COCNU|nr:Semialdehyde dehydrogenase [Cocos nucifera]
MSSAALGSIFVDVRCLRKNEVGRLEIRRRNGSVLRVKASVASSQQSLQLAKPEAQKSEKTVRIGVLGASGYTGAEIIRLLANHPQFGITLMTADKKAGQSIGSVFPHLLTQDLPDMIAVKDADFSDVDAVFCCLPHGTTQEIIKGLPTGLKIVDLSADFRLRDIDEYDEWYGLPHKAPELQEGKNLSKTGFRMYCLLQFDQFDIVLVKIAVHGVQLVVDVWEGSQIADSNSKFNMKIGKKKKEAVYGLTEVLRDEIRNARLIANPGCYPTSIQLPLIPLIKAHLIELTNIIIDAKSGVSGAGRGAKEANLYTEISEGIHSYGITKHRHVPEIEQGLSDASHSKVTVSFTPHLMPMSRGMQSTIYVQMAPGVTIEDLYQQLKTTYEIDNLVKGASGQAVQNLNLMMGFPENMGLQYQPLFP